MMLAPLAVGLPLQGGKDKVGPSETQGDYSVSPLTLLF
jgi:hypothetical protein